jgi:transposase
LAIEEKGWIDMRRIHDRVAGLDVHKKSVTVCAEWVQGKEVVLDKATFATTGAGVRGLGDWMSERGVTYVVMESTGVYWKPVYYRLEDRFDSLALVNAGHVKNMPGRKTDMSDAEWLADLAAHGMVRASFVPPPPIRALRELTRYRKQLIRARVQEIQRLEKVFQDAGIKFSSVASAVWLKSSAAMAEALIGGERDALVLAGLAKGSLANRQSALVEAMDNDWQPYHGRLARRLIDHIHSLDEMIASLSDDIVEACGPWEHQIELLCTVPGVARRSAEHIIAETGGDMSVFPTADHLASWCGLAPGNHQSANKSRPARTLFGNSTIKTVMVEAAKAGVRQDGFLRAKKARIARRRGPNKATVAVARAQIVGIWHMLTNNEPWADLGADYYTRRQDPKHEVKRHIARLEQLGFDVTLTPQT